MEDICSNEYNAYEKIELLQFQLHIDSIPVTATIIKSAVKDFIEAAHFINNAPISVFYDKDIEHFNMYMWRIRDLALDIKDSWLRRHNNEVSQDDPVLNSCVSIITKIRRAALKKGTPIQPRPDESAGQQTTKKEKIKMTFRDYIKFEDADSRIEKALSIDVSKYGTKADAFREIIRITLGEVISEKDFPSYYVFNDTFKGLISNTDFYRIRNDLLPVSETSKGYNKKFARNKLDNN